LLRVKFVAAASNNNKWFITVKCAICWIKYCIPEIKFSIDNVYSPYQVKINMILQISDRKESVFYINAVGIPMSCYSCIIQLCYSKLYLCVVFILLVSLFQYLILGTIL
jgi:hypothetical protein